MKVHGPAGGLKPCGKCGSENLTIDSKDGQWRKFGYAVRCRDCGAMTPWARLSTVARALWNSGNIIGSKLP